MIYVNFTRLPQGRWRVESWGTFLNGQPDPPYEIEPALEGWPPRAIIAEDERVTVTSGANRAAIGIRDLRPVVIEGAMPGLELYRNGLPLERETR